MNTGGLLEEEALAPACGFLCVCPCLMLLTFGISPGSSSWLM